VPTPDRTAAALAADADALRGSFAAYRALDATIAQNERRKTRRLTLPVLAIGGAEGIGAGAANTMKLAADDVQSVVIPGSGHYRLEEAPEEILAALTAFLAPYRDGPAAVPNPYPTRTRTYSGPADRDRPTFEAGTCG
jgi:pimeloyl-ACP methyl ester carboxylesterase